MYSELKKCTDKYDYCEKRKIALLGVIYENPSKAHIKINQKIKTSGISKALKIISIMPKRYSSLKGISILGHRDSTRQDAYLIIPELSKCVKASHIIKLELESHKRLNELSRISKGNSLQQGHGR